MKRFFKVILISAFLVVILGLSTSVTKAITIVEIQAQISSILSQISILQQAITLLKGGSVADCSNLWWFDNSNTECQSQKQFCGAYMYQDLQTFGNQQDCLKAAVTKKTNCVPSWKCDWAPCVNNYESQIPMDLNNCGLLLSQSNLVCLSIVQECTSDHPLADFTLLSAVADINEYDLDNYAVTGTIVFKVKLTSGTMQKFIDAAGSLDSSKPMVVINAYDSEGNIINIGSQYRYIFQTPYKDLITGDEATITVQQVINYPSKDQVKPVKFKIDFVNYEINNVLGTYANTANWYTNSVALPTISLYRLNLMANIGEIIKKISQFINQLSGN